MLSPLLVPLSAGGELRLVVEGGPVDLQMWSTYPDGHALMGGGIRMTPGDLRLALHALRTALWATERAEGGFRVPSVASEPRAA